MSGLNVMASGRLGGWPMGMVRSGDRVFGGNGRVNLGSRRKCMDGK